jgi:hypothetical protein
MKFLVAALLVGSSVAAFASTGSLSAVQGNVILSSGKTSSKAAPGAVLKDGDLVFVSSGSSAMIQVAKCNISLTAGQSLVVNSTLPCVDLSASVKSTILPKTVVAADTNGFVDGFPGGPFGLGLTVIGTSLIIREATKKTSGS